MPIYSISEHYYVYAIDIARWDLARVQKVFVELSPYECISGCGGGRYWQTSGWMFAQLYLLIYRQISGTIYIAK